MPFRFLVPFKCVLFYGKIERITQQYIGRAFAILSGTRHIGKSRKPRDMSVRYKLCHTPLKLISMLITGRELIKSQRLDRLRTRLIVFHFLIA